MEDRNIQKTGSKPFVEERKYRGYQDSHKGHVTLHEINRLLSTSFDVKFIIMYYVTLYDTIIRIL